MFEYFCENCEEVFDLPRHSSEPVRCPGCLQWDAYINDEELVEVQ